VGGEKEKTKGMFTCNVSISSSSVLGLLVDFLRLSALGYKLIWHDTKGLTFAMPG
jgi:cell shape-determining protein MreD